MNFVVGKPINNMNICAQQFLDGSLNEEGHENKWEEAFLANEKRPSLGNKGRAI